MSKQKGIAFTLLAEEAIRGRKKNYLSSLTGRMLNEYQLFTTKLALLNSPPFRERGIQGDLLLQAPSKDLFFKGEHTFSAVCDMEK